MIAAWGAAEWFWNGLTLAVGGIVGIVAIFILARTVEPRGLRVLIGRLRGKA